MSRSPSLPERPRLDLDPDMTPDERLDALREHYADVVEVHETLTSQLDAAHSRQESLVEKVDRLERENETLKSSSLYIATAEELLEDGVVEIGRAHV